jgi:hypothetical protein
MKIQIPSRAGSRGVATLIFIIIIAILCGSSMVYFLTSAQQEYGTVARSQAWNSSMVLAEAGIEEGLQLVNSSSWPYGTNILTSGWSQSANVFTITRTLDTNIGSYTVYVTNANTEVYILSVGSAIATDATMASNLVSRKVLVRAISTSPFPGALTMQTTINMNGNNVTVDSYDSNDPYHSYWPGYPSGRGYGIYTNTGSTINSVRKNNGDVATDGAITGVISVGNGQIYGFVDTGPGGTTQVGANGSVGDLSWVNGGSTGIEAGYSRDDMNVAFPAVTPPTTNWISVPNNTTITNSGFYAMSAISSGMTISGQNVVLYVTNGIGLGGNNALTIATNSTVTMYVGGAIVENGNGAINNLTQHAQQFVVWGLPSLTTITLTGNGALWGAIYAPNAAVSFKGGGNSGGYYGSLTGNSIVLTGNSTFSYDEQLKNMINGGFVIISWAEVY